MDTIGILFVMFLITVDTVIIIKYLSSIEKCILSRIMDESDEIKFCLISVSDKLLKKK